MRERGIAWEAKKGERQKERKVKRSIQEREEGGGRREEGGGWRREGGDEASTVIQHVDMQYLVSFSGCMTQTGLRHCITTHILYLLLCRRELLAIKSKLKSKTKLAVVPAQLCSIPYSTLCKIQFHTICKIVFHTM